MEAAGNSHSTVATTAWSDGSAAPIPGTNIYQGSRSIHHHNHQQQTHSLKGFHHPRHLNNPSDGDHHFTASVKGYNNNNYSLHGDRKETTQQRSGGANDAYPLNLEDADKLAYGRSMEWNQHRPQQQQSDHDYSQHHVQDTSFGSQGYGRSSLLLGPADRWNGTLEGANDSNKNSMVEPQTNASLWEDRDAPHHSRASGSRRLTGPGGHDIWASSSRDNSRSPATTSHSSMHSNAHNNTTLIASNPRAFSSVNSVSTTGGGSTLSHVEAPQPLWNNRGGSASVASAPAFPQDFSHGLSQLSMRHKDDKPDAGRHRTQQVSLNRRVSGGDEVTPEQSPNSCRYSVAVPQGQPEETEEDFSSSPPAYYLPSASFSDHLPSTTSHSSIADLVPASSASTYTNESSLVTAGHCHTQVPSSTNVSSSPRQNHVVVVDDDIINLVPPTPPPGFVPPQQHHRQDHRRHHQQQRSINSHHRPNPKHSYDAPPSHAPEHRHFSGQQYHNNNSNGRSNQRKESNRNNDGRRRNGRTNNSNNRPNGGGGSSRKQPRSNFPPPSSKERNSPPGKRTNYDGSITMNAPSFSSPSPAGLLRNHNKREEGSPDSNSTTKQLEHASSEAIRQLVKPKQQNNRDDDSLSFKTGNSNSPTSTSLSSESRPILPQQRPEDHADYSFHYHDFELEDDDDVVVDANGDPLFDDNDSWNQGSSNNPYGGSKAGGGNSPPSKKQDWLLRMNRKLQETPVGDLDPAVIPISAVMNSWAKSKSAQGASMVELWLLRAQQETDAGNPRVVLTNKMYTMAVDAWARSGEGGAAAQRAETLLQQMNELYQKSGDENLRPTTGIFNAVINSWARSKERMAPVRAEQILNWMQNLRPELSVQPDKYTFNTVIHAYAKAGGTEAAVKAQELLTKMHKLYQEGNLSTTPDTITYNVVINCWAKSGGKGAANEAEKLLSKMHQLHSRGDPDVKPNVVSYGAVIDAFAKCGEHGAAARADTLLANMIELHQSDPIRHADLMPNTYVFNTCINCWAKSKEPDAASKAEEMLVAMSRLHSSGMPSLKPDAFTYTAVIDAWAKSGYRGAASRADQLLDKMEAKYLAGDADLKPNTFTYNAVINSLAKSGEAGAAARAERVLQNMVNRHRNGGGDDVKPTTVNFNTVLDAWAKSGGGRAAAERAEEILEWMDRLHKQGNEVNPDTISFNAVIDAWARSGDRVAPRRAEQILDHMDELYRAGNSGVKPDTYSYNTLINAWAKSGERGSAARAEHVLSVMEKRYRDGDSDFKPNTRTHTSVIDSWAKSGEKGAAQRANQILNNMITRYEATGDTDSKPNVHTANAVCNACAFSKHDDDRVEALQIAFRVFDWLSSQNDMTPDSYTFTILLSVCANLIPRHDGHTRYAHARAFFERCRDSGYVNDYVLRKLRQTVTEDEFQGLVEYRTELSASAMPPSWSRNARLNGPSKQQNHNRKGKWHGRRRG